MWGGIVFLIFFCYVVIICKCLAPEGVQLEYRVVSFFLTQSLCEEVATFVTEFVKEFLGQCELFIESMAKFFLYVSAGLDKF